MKKSIAQRAADNIRVLTAAMVEKAKSGHPGGAMGGADFTQILYSEFLSYDPDMPDWFRRDRFFLDPGHMSPMLYAQLALLGNYSMEDLKNFRQWKSCTPGHPELDLKRGVENTSGPLGQGHTMAVGAAIAAKFFKERFGDWSTHYIYTFISDGGIQEEISQGAGRIAGYLKLDNLIMFYDSNDVQLSTMTNDVSAEDTAKKYEAWGWHVITINGNDESEIRNALKEARDFIGKPCLIIGKTIMGLGARNSENEKMEGLCSTHGQPLSKAGVDIEATIKNLGGDPEDPFQIYNDVAEYYKQIRQNKKAEAKEKQDIAHNWLDKNPEAAKEFLAFVKGEMLQLDFESIELKRNAATRAASASILAYLSEHLQNLIVSSADLSNSDKTDGFLKHTKPMKAEDFSGRFLHAGVSELTMASVMNGIALHGGLRAACGTFFVFSDYMKPALRLSALQELPVIYVWSHDAFRVGEDGPTHQPVEHLAQIRLMEKVYNHSGKRSLMVLRPADAEETRIAWQMALENTKTPSGLILSRQNITDLPGTSQKSRKEIAEQARKGGYIVNEDEGEPDMIFVGNGSEVRTLYEAAELLRERKKLKIRIVSIMSEGIFRDQSPEYQNSVLPDRKPIFGLTAGLPSTLSSLVGGNGKAYGLSHFGYSAPADVLDEKFGFTAENIFTHSFAYFENFHAQ